MKTFKTKSTHLVPCNRKIIDTIVYLSIVQIEMTKEGVVSRGHYYILDEEGEKQILDYIYPALLPWSTIGQLETQLSAFTSNSLQNAINQRAEEFAMLKLQQEGTANYGIEPNDWELYVEQTEDEENEEDETEDN